MFDWLFGGRKQPSHAIGEDWVEKLDRQMDKHQHYHYQQMAGMNQQLQNQMNAMRQQMNQIGGGAQIGMGQMAQAQPMSPTLDPEWHITHALVLLFGDHHAIINEELKLLFRDQQEEEAKLRAREQQDALSELEKYATDWAKKPMPMQPAQPWPTTSNKLKIYTDNKTK